MNFARMAFLAATLLTCRAFAADLPTNDLPQLPPPPAPQPWISEVRAGVFAHNVYGGFILSPTRLDDFDFSRIEDINVEILSKPFEWYGDRWNIDLRANLGATFSTTGRENLAHTGFAFTKHIGNSPVFVEGSFGLAVHDGYLNNPPIGSGFRRLGCRVQFHESFSLGVYITQNLNLMATYEHTSNAGLCQNNAGLSNAGIRAGFKF